MFKAACDTTTTIAGRVPVYEGIYFQVSEIAEIEVRRSEPDRLGLIHFDVSHFQHIAWKDHEDLRIRLRDKILALSGNGKARKQAHA